MVVFCLLLTRGALELQFRAMGLILPLLSVMPGIIEALCTSYLGKVFFEMPTKMSYSLGFFLASVGTTAVVPNLLNLRRQGYGKRKHIMHEVLMATTLDNLLFGTLFSIMRSLALNEYQVANRLVFNGQPSFRQNMTRLVIALSGGIIVGIILTGIGYAISFIHGARLRKWSLLVLFLTMIVAVPVVADQTKYSEGKYFCLILTAYLLQKLFGHHSPDLPTKTLEHLFVYMQPFIYGTAGAEINLHVIEGAMVWKSCVIVLVAVLVRFIVSFLVCFSRFYHNLRLTWKEQVFVALVWCVKGSVQAILSY